MKRILAMLMAAMMLFALTACGGSGAAEPAGSEPAAEAAKQATPASSGEPMDAEVVESGYAVDGGYLYYSVTAPFLGRWSTPCP